MKNIYFQNKNFVYNWLLIESLYSNFIFCNVCFSILTRKGFIICEEKFLTFINLFAKQVKRYHLISLIKKTETQKQFLNL